MADRCAALLANAAAAAEDEIHQPDPRATAHREPNRRCNAPRTFISLTTLASLNARRWSSRICQASTPSRAKHANALRTGPGRQDAHRASPKLDGAKAGSGGCCSTSRDGGTRVSVRPKTSPVSTPTIEPLSATPGPNGTASPTITQSGKAPLTNRSSPSARRSWRPYGGVGHVPAAEHEAEVRMAESANAPQPRRVVKIGPSGRRDDRRSGGVAGGWRPSLSGPLDRHRAQHRQWRSRRGRGLDAATGVVPKLVELRCDGGPSGPSAPLGSVASPRLDRAATVPAPAWLLRAAEIG
jgi:hypothetical protein